MLKRPDTSALRRAMPQDPVEARRSYTGPALFSFGFRPFFLGGAIWGALVVPVWIAAWVLGWSKIGGVPALAWHVHEMLFGFLGAIVAGFLLTAVPNWTGRLPVMGGPLLALAALWLAGRLAMLVGGPVLLVAVMDASFLLVLAALLWREVITGGNFRNFPVCGLASLFALANLGFHAAIAFGFDWRPAQGVAIAVIAMLIGLIGGRIVPSFTRNWMAQTGRTPLPAPAGRLDMFALGALAASLVAWILWPWSAVTGLLLAAAGILHAVRLARWKGWRTGAEGLVLILHAGYVWLPLALLLMAGGILLPGLVPASAALHALTAGAMGTMTLAVMTRASLGHTGRARTADRTTTAIYALVLTAAVVRVLVPIVLPLAIVPVLAVSAVLWSAAFGLFALRYGPMLAKPRVTHD
ncbi:MULTISPECIES: NnrS family protein [Hyphobacterium]|uniref:NnrS family protein n=1 Tax=Hyphobacterium vulgare TaxID=1736751 RepID=A0ABV6ZX37_9PROT